MITTYKNSSDMNTRKKIEEILLTDYGCFDEFTVDKLCDLFSVSQQREQLLAYHKHLDSFNDPTIYNATEDMIDDYLANNCG